MPCSSVSKQEEFKRAFISLLFCARQELKTLPSSRWHLSEVPEGRTLLSGLSLCPSCELWVPTPVVGQGWANTSALATGSPKRCLWSPAGRWPRALADRPQGSGMLSGQVGKESRQLSWWNSRLKPYGRMIHANKRGWNIHMGSWFVRQRKIHLLMEKLGQNPMRRAYPVVSAQLQGSCKWASCSVSLKCCAFWLSCELLVLTYFPHALFLPLCLAFHPPLVFLFFSGVLLDCLHLPACFHISLLPVHEFDCSTLPLLFMSLFGSRKTSCFQKNNPS